MPRRCPLAWLVSLYRDRVVPWLIHHAMRQPRIAAERRRVVPHAQGRVLEIGIGSGLNLPLYGPAVARVVGIDPSPRLLSRARAARPAGLALDLIETGAEAIPVADGSFDCAVSTWTLCSIPDVAAALAKVRRVLKPGGTFLFIEHGRAAEASVARWQDRLNPLWCRCAGGCNMNRPIAALVADAGLGIERLETGYLDFGPRVLTYHYAGAARR